MTSKTPKSASDKSAHLVTSFIVGVKALYSIAKQLKRFRTHQSHETASHWVHSKEYSNSRNPSSLLNSGTELEKKLKKARGKSIFHCVQGSQMEQSACSGLKIARQRTEWLRPKSGMASCIISIVLSACSSFCYFARIKKRIFMFI
jgi:hypothetical protein